MSREIIQKARDIVANKWHKGSYTDGNGGYCIMGALGMARGGEILYADADLLVPHLQDLGWKKCTNPSHRTTEICDHIPHFNDDPNTTKEMVLQLFDKTLANL